MQIKIRVKLTAMLSKNPLAFNCTVETLYIKMEFGSDRAQSHTYIYHRQISSFSQPKRAPCKYAASQYIQFQACCCCLVVE